MSLRMDAFELFLPVSKPTTTAGPVQTPILRTRNCVPMRSVFGDALLKATTHDIVPEVMNS